MEKNNEKIEKITDEKISKKERFVSSKYFKKSIYALLVTIISITFYFIQKNFSGIGAGIGTIFGVFLPFIIGFSIAFLLNPILNFIEKHLKKVIKKDKILRGISVLLTFIFAILIIFLIILIITPKLLDSLNELFIIVMKAVNGLSILVIDFLERTNLEDYLTQEQITEISGYAGRIIESIYSAVQAFIPQILAITGSFTKTVFNIILGFIVAIYFLTGKEKFSAQFKKILYSFLKEEQVTTIIDFAQLTNKIFNKYIVGQLLDAVIVGVISFILMSILGLPYALLISIIVGLTNVIPYFGPFLGAIPSVFILLAVNPRDAIVFGIMILVIQQIDGNIISPKVLGESTGLSGFFILFAVAVGGDLFGIIGMILGVPIFAIVYTLLVLLVNKKLNKKGLSSSTLDYYKVIEAKDIVSTKKESK